MTRTWHYWSPEEDRTLARVYEKAPWEEIHAALPGRGKQAIQQRAFQRGLKRNRARCPKGDPSSPVPLFIRQLRDLRIDMGLSQSDVAQMMGCSLAAIGFWEAGRIMPKMVNIMRWCDALEAELMIGDKDEPAK